MPVRKQGITAVEVMVSTLLASLLMVAMLGVMRGLRAQASALENRLPIPSWQQTLDSVLQADIENSRTYEFTSNAIILKGYAGRDVVTGTPTWKPTTIAYEIVNDETRSWLVRRDLASLRMELVLAEVTSLRVGSLSVTDAAKKIAAQDAEPIVDGLVIEFWGDDPGGPLYGYRFQKP